MRMQANAGMRSYHFGNPALPNRLHDENTAFPALLRTGGSRQVSEVSGDLSPTDATRNQIQQCQSALTRAQRVMVQQDIFVQPPFRIDSGGKVTWRKFWIVLNKYSFSCTKTSPLLPSHPPSRFWLGSLRRSKRCLRAC